jgi:WD40 repeat protein
MDPTAWNRLTDRFPRVPTLLRIEQRDDRAAPGAPIVTSGSPLLTLAFSADGRWLAAAGGGLLPGPAAVHIIDLERRAVVRICHAHVMGIFDVAFDPRTGLMASASHDYSVLLWDIGDRDDAIYLIGDPHAGVSRHRVAFAGHRILIGDGETFSGARASVTSIDLDAGTRRTLVELDDDQRLGIEALEVLPGGTHAVVVVDRMRDAWFASELRVLSLDGGEVARWTTPSQLRSPVAVDGGDLVVVANRDDDDDEQLVELIRCDAWTGDPRAARPFPGGCYAALAASPDRGAVVAAYDQTVEVRDVQSLEPRWRVDLGGDEALSVAWSPAGAAIAVGTAARAVRLFDPVTGAERLD